MPCRRSSMSSSRRGSSHADLTDADGSGDLVAVDNWFKRIRKQ
jgi:hypothetical protein